MMTKKMKMRYINSSFLHLMNKFQNKKEHSMQVPKERAYRYNNGGLRAPIYSSSFLEEIRKLIERSYAVALSLLVCEVCTLNKL